MLVSRVEGGGSGRINETDTYCMKLEIWRFLLSRLFVCLSLRCSCLRKGHGVWCFLSFCSCCFLHQNRFIIHHYRKGQGKGAFMHIHRASIIVISVSGVFLSFLEMTCR